MLIMDVGLRHFPVMRMRNVPQGAYVNRFNRELIPMINGGAQGRAIR